MCQWFRLALDLRPGALGGFKGRKIEAGDELPVVRLRPAVKEGPYAREELRGCRWRYSTGRCAYAWPYWHRITMPPEGGSFMIPGSRSGSRRSVLPLQGRQAARVRAARATIRSGLRSLQSPMPCYPYGLDQVPGGTEPIVMHVDGFRRRLLHGRQRHFRQMI